MNKLKIGVILPKNISNIYLKRLENLIYYFFDTDNIFYFSPYDNFAKKIPNFVNKNIFNVNILVIARDENENNPDFSWELDIPIFKTIFQGHGGLRLISGKYKFKNNKNFFRKIALLNNFAYAPYSYQNNFNVFNDENSLGFRMREDFYKLSNRDNSHKVIAIFGGSAVYDLSSLMPFSKRIEKKLNNVSVLNFGLYGGNILNDILNFNNYCYNIKPDIVIHYGGFNDIVNSMTSDSVLLKKYNISYPSIYTEWLNILYNANEKHYTKNSPYLIMQKYIERIKQFKNLVESIGSKFIYIFQPYYYKKHLSQKEIFFIKYYFSQNKNKLLINNVNMNYEIYKNFFKFEYLDLYQKFLNKDDFIFTDLVHINEHGSEIVAKEIIKYLKDKYVL